MSATSWRASGAAHLLPAGERGVRLDVAVRRIPHRDGYPRNAWQCARRRLRIGYGTAARWPARPTLQRDGDADADRTQSGRHARHPRAVRVDRRIRRGDCRSRSRHRRGTSAHVDPRSADRATAARRGAEAALCRGARHRQDDARPARTVVDAAAAAQDTRQRRRILRLLDPGDLLAGGLGTRSAIARSAPRVRNVAAGVVQPHRTSLTAHLAADPVTRAWIDAYDPAAPLPR